MTGAALPADFMPKIEALWAMRDTADFTALGLGIATIATILVLRRIAPKVPWMIFVIAAASALAAFQFPSVETVGERYGEMPHGLPMPSLPHFNAEIVAELLPSAFTIAFLVGIESLLSAIVADRMIGASHRSNAELLAQGVANMASPLFGGLPATGAIARTATNVNAGGRTPVAGMIHALTILAFILLAGPLVGSLALPALAGLLMVTAWNMSEPHRFAARLQLPKEELALLVLTAVLTVLVDLTVAIGVGTIIGLALRLRDGKLEAPRWHTPIKLARRRNNGDE